MVGRADLALLRTRGDGGGSRFRVPQHLVRLATQCGQLGVDLPQSLIVHNIFRQTPQDLIVLVLAELELVSSILLFDRQQRLVAALYFIVEDKVRALLNLSSLGHGRNVISGLHALVQPLLRDERPRPIGRGGIRRRRSLDRGRRQLPHVPDSSRLRVDLRELPI